MSNVKLRLKAGRREIEIEGSISDVEKLLTDWWHKGTHVDDANDDEEEGDEEDDTSTDESGGKKRTRKRTRSQPATGDGAVRQTFDATAFSNKVKQDKKFAIIKSKIIIGSPTVWRKTAFVFWYANKGLTSGDITRCLIALGIRTDLPAISKAINANKENFTLSGKRERGGGAVHYTLTEAARHEFEEWLNDAGE